MDKLLPRKWGERKSAPAQIGGSVYKKYLGFVSSLVLAESFDIRSSIFR